MAKTVIMYFGTTTREAGHFFWDVYDEGLHNRSLNIGTLPFNPEDIVKTGTPFGTVKFEYVEDFSVLSISGSCRDTRQGTKSVFWAPRKVSYEVFKNWILKTESTKELINKMPFEVKWKEYEDTL